METENKLRARLIQLGIIIPNAHPVKDCVCANQQCAATFQVLEGYFERFCGCCQYPRRCPHQPEVKPGVITPIQRH